MVSSKFERVKGWASSAVTEILSFISGGVVGENHQSNKMIPTITRLNTATNVRKPAETTSAKSYDRREEVGVAEDGDGGMMGHKKSSTPTRDSEVLVLDDS